MKIAFRQIDTEKVKKDKNNLMKSLYFFKILLDDNREN
jgi:hypothetical protein